MKRWLFNLVAAVSLLLSLTAAAGWAMSYARPLDWHLLGIAHSADLTRVNLDRRTAVSMTPVNGSDAPRYGRSEEHTSELQSRQYLVCRLLLEKKKNQSLQYRLA